MSEMLLILATGGREGMRNPLTAAISQDEGETWIHSRNIAEDPDGDYGYQNVTFVDDMVIMSYMRWMVCMWPVLELIGFMGRADGGLTLVYVFVGPLCSVVEKI